MCMSASAQVSTSSIKVSGWLRTSIPTEFLKSDKPYVVMEIGDGYREDFIIYDELFNEVKRISYKSGYPLAKTYEREYNPTTEKYDGEWQLVEEETLTDYPIDVMQRPGYENYNLGSFEGHGVLFTQTLFNEDEYFEYIIPLVKEVESYIYERDRDNDGISDYKEERQSFELVGFKVMSENGNEVTRFSVTPDYDDENDIDIIRMGEHYYFVNGASCYDEEGKWKEHVIEIFSIDRTTTEIKKVVEHRGLKCLPSIAKKNEVINVTLEADNVATQILVTSVGGQTVKKLPIQAGQKSVSLHTSGLPAGMYVVSTTDGKNKNEYCKIIIR